jgi:hypothetical protein
VLKSLLQTPSIEGGGEKEEGMWQHEYSRQREEEGTRQYVRKAIRQTLATIAKYV